MTDPAAKGNREIRHGVIARLLMQHRAALYGYIYACLRNHPDTEDVFQNVSVAVTESIDQLRDEAGFLPWAREIARRRILAFQREARRKPRLIPRSCGPWPRRRNESSANCRRRLIRPRWWPVWNRCRAKAAN